MEQNFRLSYDVRVISEPQITSEIYIAYRSGEAVENNYILLCDSYNKCYLKRFSWTHGFSIVKNENYKFEDGVWHHFEISVFGNQHSITINNKLVLEAQDDKNIDAGEYLLFAAPNYVMFDLDNIELYELIGK